MAPTPEARKLILDGLAANARAIRDSTQTRDNLIVKALKLGIPQTAVAKASGMSQAHISRTLTADRERVAARKAARAAKPKNEGGTV